MRILNYSFETKLNMSSPITDHDFVLRCQPMSTHVQTVLDAQTVITPECSLASQTDGFGNLIQVGRIERPHSGFSFVSSGLVIVDDADTHPAPAHPIYLRPSRFCTPTPELTAFAAGVLRVRRNAPAMQKAACLATALHELMEYAPGSTTTATTAGEAFAQKSGVCQDFSHILIALLRGEGIPARYVNGLMFGEGATHAWVEMHDGLRWRGVDPTNDRVVDDSYIAIAHGRDFADCPIESGVFRGGARQDQNVRVVVQDQQ